MARLLALVCDRDATLRARLQDRLGAMGFRSLGAVSSAEAGDRAREQPLDLVLGSPGDWIADSRDWPGHPLRVALFADRASLLESGASWIDRGVDDVLDLEGDERATALALRRLAAWCEQRDRDTRGRGEESEPTVYGELVGPSAALDAIRERLQRLAPLDENVWIEGEAGAGKQSCARALHRLAAQPDAPFVLFESADLESPGWEERWLSGSDDGVSPRMTLYLAEPGAFAPAAVERLQRLMLKIDAREGRGMRVVSGSTPALERLVDEGRLPAPLAALLSPARFAVPPLRERPEDVGPLALYFIRSIEQVNRLASLRLSADALDQLEAYGWPGNVRELRHAIEHAAILADGTIELTHLPRNLREAAVPSSFRGEELAARPFREAKGDVVAEFEQAYLGALMKRLRGNVTAAAREAGMLRSALQRLLRKYNLKSADFRRRPAAPSTTPTRATRPG